MPEASRQRDPEFKAGAVRMVPETRRPVAEVVRDLAICEDTPSSCARRDRAERSGAALDGDDRSGLVRLCKRCAEPEAEA